MLTYFFSSRVARNLKMSSDWKRHKRTVLELLKNCLAILDAAKYPQVKLKDAFPTFQIFFPNFKLLNHVKVAIAALYHLSDIYLPTSFKVSEPDESSESPEESWEYQWDDGDVDDEFS